MSNSKFVLLYCWSKDEPTHIEKYVFPIVRETKTKYCFSDGTDVRKRDFVTLGTGSSRHQHSDFFVGMRYDAASLTRNFFPHPIALLQFPSDTEDNAECDRKAKELFLSKQIPAKISSIKSQQEYLVQRQKKLEKELQNLKKEQEQLEKELPNLKKEQEKYENIANTGNVKFQTVSPFRTDVP